MASSNLLIQMDRDEFWKKLREVVDELMVHHDKRVSFQALKSRLTPKLLKVTEVCLIFRITKPTLYSWMRQGHVDSVKVGARRLFRFEQYLLHLLFVLEACHQTL
jgi:excisionase family DNA binding protein